MEQRIVQRIIYEEPTPIPAHYSQFLQLLVKRMLDKEAKARPSAADILNLCHIQPWKAELSKAAKSLVPVYAKIDVTE